MSSVFENRLSQLMARHEKLVSRPNEKLESINGIYSRFRYPVLTAQHVPPDWRFDLNPETNPYLLERMGINAVFNAGAILHDGRYLVVARVEGVDRKSFLAIAESDTGVDGFRFWDRPIVLPETPDPDINVYDMRLTKHQDGWIYGVFCTERKDPAAAPDDTSTAVAQAGIARTHDLLEWQRLPDLKSNSPQQRNVVLHPEFVDGKYAFYTRPQDGFIETGTGGGIGWGLCSDIENAVVEEEMVIDDRHYHTIKETKNGQGPPPIKTEKGWLHLAHGVRGTAAGLRYVLYILLSDLDEPWRVTHRPGGYFMAPEGEERVGDVSNVVFSNGWIETPDRRILIYYASSDTKLHVAETDVDRLLDYAVNTPPDSMRSARAVTDRIDLINQNRGYQRPR